MGTIKLVKALKDIRQLKKEADVVLEDIIVERYPELESAYDRWSDTYRMNTTAVCAYMAYHFCRLEGVDFDSDRKKKAYVSTAAAVISDDLIDYKIVKDASEAYMLQSSGITDKNTHYLKALFNAFNSYLEEILPDSFCTEFKELIEQYNLAQEKSLMLDEDISKDDIILIKNGTGGYPSLLLYSIMFPENEDHVKDIDPSYPVNSKLPSKKSQAIFNYGVMVSHLDDIMDLNYDKIMGKKSLATEGIISWDSLNSDIRYVGSGLEKFYPKKNVKDVMNLFSPTSIRTVLFMLNMLERISRFSSSR
ncbi:MAG: hypothetical protein KAR23_03840 [Candidatus Aenigmarchaeota archaeon]|nr:hypothetical protein [Candidatus Aenigmarchaeota archaeon]